MGSAPERPHEAQGRSAPVIVTALAPDRPEAVRKELNHLNHAVVREIDQAKCDVIEARIRELESSP